MKTCYPGNRGQDRCVESLDMFVRPKKRREDDTGSRDSAQKPRLPRGH